MAISARMARCEYFNALTLSTPTMSKAGFNRSSSLSIVYISKGRIVAAAPKEGFIRQHSLSGESLEETILRMEGGAIDA